ncbi:hypothetical protein [Acetobacter thailandicus]|uniref:Uncharacterized protein n=1 Tax=Acetobacter thailandicus TaxID=1502842 RepID=A0ABT3QFP7_9PROT|nr:hypothetical protein [Acetobacter thailandicus]MCX2564080.1 hypothetical protein [Acetobacter thailandicus]NHN95424.1 hypothetical protein [Acetobacter thailandicus]
MAEMTWRDAIIKVLQGSNSAMSYTEITDSINALLIERLEPPQNRKRGDDFNTTEFLQVKDPRVEHEGLLAQLGALREKITGN